MAMQYEKPRMEIFHIEEDDVLTAAGSLDDIGIGGDFKDESDLFGD